MLIKIFCWLCLKDLNKLIKILSHIEYGFGIFLEKLAKRALSEDRIVLHELLTKQSQEEKHHGDILNRFINGKDHFKLCKNGFFRKIETSSEIISDNSSEPLFSLTYKTTWIDKKGEKVFAKFQNFDGISDRYPSSNFFFNNISPCEYDWINILAIYCVLEKKVGSFYKELSYQLELRGEFVPAAIALKISNDERSHGQRSLELLKEFSSNYIIYLIKWESRMLMSIPLIAKDLFNFVYK